MPKINIKSDFDFILALMVECSDGVLRELGIPKCEFVARLTSGNGQNAKAYVASRCSDEGDMNIDAPLLDDGHQAVLQYRQTANPGYVNCYDDGGRLHIVVDGHGLSRGSIYCEFTILRKDAIYPDEVRTVVATQKLDIDLVAMGGEDCDVFTVPIYLPQAFEAMSETVLGEENPLEEGTDALTVLAKAYGDALKGIRSALGEKGVNVSDDDTFATLAQKIREMN